MSHVTHHTGLELPIYDDCTRIVCGLNDLTTEGERGPSDGQDTFVRGVKLEYSGQGTLKNALQLADQLIPQTAAAIGAVAIAPSWGLYRGDSEAFWGDNYIGHHLVPADYILVAEVPYVINPCRLSKADQMIDVNERSREFSDAKLSNNQPYIRDIDWRQVVVGSLPDNPVRQLYLVDIEPRIVMSIDDLMTEFQPEDES